MKKRSFLLLFSALFAASAFAQVHVTGSSGGKRTISLSGLRTGSDAASRTFVQTLENDLLLSGWLAPTRGTGDFALTGSVAPQGNTLRASILAVQTSNRARLLSKGYSLDATQARRLAHQAADDLILAITGHKGMASTRIALVSDRTGKKELYLCDADGKGMRQLTADKSIVTSPNWGPDGNTIFYTSYFQGFPDIYSLDLTRGSRKRIANYGGLNAGAAISPDGKMMALILSKDGNPELYVQNLSGGAPKRITNTLRATEASPSWSPDGRHIVFVSDQSGTPQLYLIGRNGGQTKRLSRRGSENVAPDWGPNGLIVCSSREDRRYHIALINPSTGETRYMPTDSADYEDPSWAPDGRHLIATRTLNYQSALYLLDTLNDPPVALVNGEGNWRSPAWSPR
jgi:TolB protein